MPAIEIVGLRKTFGGVVALAGVDAMVDSDEILGVIGPNGSGKTTFLNVICGLHKPTAGQVRWRGQDITGRRPHQVAKLGIAHTFQQAMSFRTCPVHENVQIALEHGTARADRSDRRLSSPEAILDFVGLTGSADAPANSLSFGDLRRLGLAIALGAHPRQLMLDEPAAGLNSAESADLASLLLRIHAMGVGVCIIDHDMRMMASLCRRLIVLDFGYKIADGPTAAVLADPKVVDIYLGAEA